MDQNKIFVGIILIITGLFLLIYGAKLLNSTVYIIGTLATVTLGLVVFVYFFNAENESTIWIVIGVNTLIGIYLSWLLVKSISIFVMVLGGDMGYTLGLFVYQLGVNRITGINPDLLYWITIVLCIVIGFVIGNWLVKHVLIIGTSFRGGYGIIRVLSLFLKHFPGESVIIYLVNHEEWKQLEQVK